VAKWPKTWGNDPVEITDALGNLLRVDRLPSGKWRVTTKGEWELTFASEPVFGADCLSAASRVAEAGTQTTCFSDPLAANDYAADLITQCRFVRRWEAAWPGGTRYYVVERNRA
jgi:hypothetical protein